MKSSLKKVAKYVVYISLIFGSAWGSIKLGNSVTPKMEAISTILQKKSDVASEHLRVYCNDPSRYCNDVEVYYFDTKTGETTPDITGEKLILDKVYTQHKFSDYNKPIVLSQLGSIVSGLFVLFLAIILSLHICKDIQEHFSEKKKKKLESEKTHMKKTPQMEIDELEKAHANLLKERDEYNANINRRIEANQGVINMKRIQLEPLGYRVSVEKPGIEVIEYTEEEIPSAKHLNEAYPTHFKKSYYNL